MKEMLVTSFVPSSFRKKNDQKAHTLVLVVVVGSGGVLPQCNDAGKYNSNTLGCGYLLVPAVFPTWTKHTFSFVLAVSAGVVLEVDDEDQNRFGCFCMWSGKPSNCNPW
jgi:hypothetical protein